MNIVKLNSFIYCRSKKLMLIFCLFQVLLLLNSNTFQLFLYDNVFDKMVNHCHDVNNILHDWDYGKFGVLTRTTNRGSPVR